MKKSPLDDKELDVLNNFIEETFGENDSFFDRKSDENPNLNPNLKMYVVYPTVERPYYTVVTMGLSDYTMNITGKLAELLPNRLELVMYVSADWDTDNSDDPDRFLVFNILMAVGNVLIDGEVAIPDGSTVNFGEPVRDDSKLSVAMVMHTDTFCTLPNGDKVAFRPVCMLSDGELQFRKENGVSAIVERLTLVDSENPLLTIFDREPVADENTTVPIDFYDMHASKIEKKELDTESINACNHISVFILWCIENDLIDAEFTEFFGQDIEEIKSGDYDIRKFFLNSLGGVFDKEILSDTGKQFVDYYYKFGAGKKEPSYPSDVDKMALEYFGEEKYNCEEFRDEAYLFVPYDEKYKKRMFKFINANYKKFLKNKK